MIAVSNIFYPEGARSKPVPPPRSHSLETFGKKFDDDNNDSNDDKVDADVDVESNTLFENSTDLTSSQIYENFGEVYVENFRRITSSQI